jgi:fucose permease
LLNQKLHGDGIFCDLAKAFDCVNHTILLTKLLYFGIQGAMASWFRSYLSDRKQNIEIKSAQNHLLITLLVNYGVDCKFAINK